MRDGLVVAIGKEQQLRAYAARLKVRDGGERRIRGQQVGGTVWWQGQWRAYMPGGSR